MPDPFVPGRIVVAQKIDLVAPAQAAAAAGSKPDLNRPQRAAGSLSAG